MQPSDLLRVHHSLIAADALIDVVGEAYDLGWPMTCRLLSANANDHYLITSSTTTAVLRVYHHDHYWLASAAHYQFEDVLIRWGAASSYQCAQPPSRIFTATTTSCTLTQRTS